MRFFIAVVFAVLFSHSATAQCSDWFITPDCGAKGFSLSKRAAIATDFSASRRLPKVDYTVSVVDDSRYLGVGGMSYREPVRGLKKVGRTVTRHAKRAIKKPSNLISGYAKHVARTGTKDLSGYPEPLVAKVREIESACGSKVISAYRPGARVRGSGRLSLHAVRRAVDMQGNPACMRSHLVGWRGGSSTDYGRVGHLHISYEPGGREWGSRFSHGGKSKSRTRYASKRHRYATAGGG